MKSADNSQFTASFFNNNASHVNNLLRWYSPLSLQMLKPSANKPVSSIRAGLVSGVWNLYQTYKRTNRSLCPYSFFSAVSGRALAYFPIRKTVNVGERKKRGMHNFFPSGSCQFSSLTCISTEYPCKVVTHIFNSTEVATVTNQLRTPISWFGCECTGSVKMGSLKAVPISFYICRTTLQTSINIFCNQATPISKIFS